MRKQKEELWLKIIRILLACVFIFSGLMKAVDPVASAIKIDEYFISFGMAFMHPFSMFFAIMLNIVEFTLGFMLLFRIKVKFTSIIYLLFMIFFLCLTLWLAIAEHLETHYGYNFGVVKDCGCFGQAVEMSNLQTFLKNIVIMIPTLLILFKRKSIPDIHLTELGKWSFAFVGVIIVCGIQWYSYRHLPMIDFSNWKKGENVTETFIEKPAVKNIMFVYLNLTDSTVMNLTEDELMTISDKIPGFYEQYKYLDRKDSVISKLVRAKKDGFNMLDTAGSDHAFEILNVKNEAPVMLLLIHDLDEVNEKGIKQPILKKLVEDCQKQGIVFVGLTNSSQAEIAKFKEMYHLTFPVYQNPIDPIKGPFMVRDAIRSNPGLILIQKGVVKDKWAWRDFPTYEEIQ
ncbi:MAG: DoxX family protein [Bacteroidales bacterium]